MLPKARWVVIVWREEPLFPDSRYEAIRYYFKDEELARYWVWMQMNTGADRAEVRKTIVFSRHVYLTN